jgi:hypothetical protein
VDLSIALIAAIVNVGATVAILHLHKPPIAQGSIHEAIHRSHPCSLDNFPLCLRRLAIRA